MWNKKKIWDYYKVYTILNKLLTIDILYIIKN